MQPDVILKRCACDNQFPVHPDLVIEPSKCLNCRPDPPPITCLKTSLTLVSAAVLEATPEALTRARTVVNRKIEALSREAFSEPIEGSFTVSKDERFRGRPTSIRGKNPGTVSIEFEETPR